jgi:hypothetical protein
LGVGRTIAIALADFRERRTQLLKLIAVDHGNQNSTTDVDFSVLTQW